jgi:small subunit ribosomal protein S20
LPHHKSAKKRVKTAEKARLRNRENRSELRTALKSFRAAPAAGAPDRKAKLPEITSLVDVQARKGIIPKSRAARLKSRLANLANKG